VTSQKVADIGAFIRERRRQAQLSLRKLSELAGVSNPYLSQIERGLRRPSAKMLQAIAKALRVSAETLYVQAGLLDERTGPAEVIRAILRDPGLTQRQREALASMYEQFRFETAERRSRRRQKMQAVAGGDA
jgi:transcriptional regulator with XRE-family HTH domain